MVGFAYGARRHFALLAVAALTAGYIALFATLALARHAEHLTSVFDLGVYDQVVWNTAQGRILAYSSEPEFGGNFLATHLQPILILLAPLYWLWDDVRVLFIVQTVMVAFAALPLFWLARRKTGSDLAAVTVAGAYLLLPATEAINLFDFHPETFAPLLCITVFLCVDMLVTPNEATGERSASLRLYLCFWICTILALAIKEDMALIVGMLGLYIITMHRRWRLGGAVTGVAALWFIVGVFLVMPYFHHGQLSPFLTYYATLGDSPQSIFWNALTKPALTASLLFTPENGVAMAAFLLPTAALPIVGLPVFLIAVPALLLNGLSDNPLMHLMEDKHYASTIIPFVLLATVDGLARLRRLAPRLRLQPHLTVRVAAVLLISASLGYHYFRGFTPLSRLYQPPNITAHDAIASELEAQIPGSASLVAQDRLYPHLSHREQIRYQWPSDNSADYIFLDIDHSQFFNVNDLHGFIKQQVSEQSNYGLVAARDGYLLLRRGAAHATLPAAFFSFAQPPNPRIDHPLQANFGGEFRFVGYNFTAPRDGELQFELFFQPLRDKLPDRLPNLYLLNDQGKSIAETRFAQPGLVWYPTSAWRSGQVTRLAANTITWTTEGMDHYAVGLSVLDQPNPQNAKRALPVQPESVTDSSRLINNGTILKLGEFEKQFGLTWLAR